MVIGSINHNDIKSWKCVLQKVQELKLEYNLQDEDILVDVLNEVIVFHKSANAKLNKIPPPPPPPAPPSRTFRYGVETKDSISAREQWQKEIDAWSEEMKHKNYNNK